jgi:chromosomal replication initiation ATPase DnaA
MTGILHALVEYAAREAGCSVAQILGYNRRHPIAYYRQIAMRLAYEEGFTAEQIGRVFNRHHTTVLYATAKMRDAEETGTQASPINELSTGGNRRAVFGHIV